VIGTLIATLLALIASTPAWADHPGALRSPAMNPVLAALLWAGAAFLVGIAIVAIVTVLGRRRRPQSPDG
jgi:hypothetical protein